MPPFSIAPNPAGIFPATLDQGGPTAADRSTSAISLTHPNCREDAALQDLRAATGAVEAHYGACPLRPPKSGHALTPAANSYRMLPSRLPASAHSGASGPGQMRWRPDAPTAELGGNLARRA